MTANQTDYSVQLMSRTLGMSRSGFYAHSSRPPCARSIVDDALTERIKAIHSASRETYGARRIHAELADEGLSVGRKRVERLMKVKSLRALAASSSPRQTAMNGYVQPMIWWIVTSMPMRQTCCGSQTSPMSRLGQAFCI